MRRIYIFNKEKLNTQERLINSAMELFQKKGYSATGINEIVEHSGAPKGVLYYHFPGGKEEIAIKVIQKYIEEHHKKMRKLLSKTHDVVKKIELYFDELIQLLTQNKNRYLSITMLSMESVNISDNVRKSCEEAYDSLKNSMIQILVQDGFNEKIAEEKATLLVCLLNGALTLSVTQKNMSPLFLAKKYVKNLLFN